MIVCFVRVYVLTKMVKEKPNSIRIYDDEGFRRRAACICVRSDAETEVSILLMLIPNYTNQFNDNTKLKTLVIPRRCYW